MVSVCRPAAARHESRRSDQYARWIDRRRRVILARRWSAGGRRRRAGASASRCAPISRTCCHRRNARSRDLERIEHRTQALGLVLVALSSPDAASPQRGRALARRAHPRVRSRAGRRRRQRRGRRAALRLGPPLPVRAARRPRGGARRAGRHDPPREAARQPAVRVADQPRRRRARRRARARGDRPAARAAARGRGRRRTTTERAGLARRQAPAPDRRGAVSVDVGAAGRAPGRRARPRRRRAPCARLGPGRRDRPHRGRRHRGRRAPRDPARADAGGDADRRHRRRVAAALLRLDPGARGALRLAGGRHAGRVRVGAPRHRPPQQRDRVPVVDRRRQRHQLRHHRAGALPRGAAPRRRRRARRWRARSADPSRGTLAAALAAAVAYASLVVTDFRGFRDFGVIGGVGMLLCWVSAYTVLPALLAVLERRRRDPAWPREPALGRWLARLSPRRPAMVAAIGGAVVLVSALGHLALPRRRSVRVRLAAAARRQRHGQRGAPLDGGDRSRPSAGSWSAASSSAPPIASRPSAIERTLRAHAEDEPGARPGDALFRRVGSIESFVPEDQAREAAGARRDPPSDRRQEAGAARARASWPSCAASARRRSAPLTEADVPAPLARRFVERDGTRGRLLFANQASRFDGWNGRHMIAFARCGARAEPARRDGGRRRRVRVRRRAARGDARRSARDAGGAAGRGAVRGGRRRAQAPRHRDAGLRRGRHDA